MVIPQQPTLRVVTGFCGMQSEAINAEFGRSTAAALGTLLHIHSLILISERSLCLDTFKLNPLINPASQIHSSLDIYN
jgi:hypothetical protein